MPAKSFDMKKYWNKISAEYLNSDQLGWGAVLQTGMPLWCNNFFDYCHRTSFYRLIRNTDFRDKRILDIGCGIGRWCAVFKEKGGIVTGIDIEPKRLLKASENPELKGVSLLEMPAGKIDFPDNSFDFVNSITVLQHIPYQEKDAAIREMCRVVKRGGHILINEITDTFDDSEQLYPLSRQEWIKAFEENSCRLIKNEGCEYIFELRFLRRFQYFLTGKKGIEREEGTIKMGGFKLFVLKMIILWSYFTETFYMNFFPREFSLAASLLFKKL